MIGDQALDLIRREALGLGQPIGFGLGGRDPRELAHRRVGQRAAGKRGRDLGERGERTCHAHPFSRRMRLVAEHALQVLVQADESEGHVDLQLLGSHKVKRLGGIERTAMSRVLPQPAVHLLPLGRTESRCHDVTLRIDPV